MFYVEVVMQFYAIFFAQNWQKLINKQKKQLVSNYLFSLDSVHICDYIITEICASVELTKL